MQNSNKTRKAYRENIFLILTVPYRSKQDRNMVLSLKFEEIKKLIFSCLLTSQGTNSEPEIR